MKLFTLDFETPVDPALQSSLEKIDQKLREQFGLAPNQTDVGLLDLAGARLAMIHPDQIEYGASIPKVAILLAYFHVHPDAVIDMSPTIRHELGLMIKRSSNELAAKYSQELGLAQIRHVLDAYHFYDKEHGGGIWVGKHYGLAGERVGDPIADHSHAVTVRQLLRFGLLLEQGQLVSPEASKAMCEIFDSLQIRHEDNKFVRGLRGRNVQILRKSGSWEHWLHDFAIVRGEGRHYILVGLTTNLRGDDYLTALATAVDDLIING